MKLPKEQYLALKKFKKAVAEERAGKIFSDHRGYLYETDKYGTVRRLSGDEFSIRILGNRPEKHILNSVNHTND